MMYDIDDLPPYFTSRIQLDDNDCWLWTGSKLSTGYGMSSYKGARTTAHRATYTELVGDIPKGLEIDHLCRVRGCVNPYHLEAVTHVVNIGRGVGGEVAAARHAAKTHCKHGHSLSGDNVYRYKNRKGYSVRYCKTCNREKQKLWQRAKREREQGAGEEV